MTYDSLCLHLFDHLYISYNEDVELTNFNPHTGDVILSLIGTLKVNGCVILVSFRITQTKCKKKLLNMFL